MNKDQDKHHIEDSDCLEAMDFLYAYLDGEIEDKETLAKVEHHLGHCKSCYSRAEMERLLNKRLKETGNETAPESLQTRIRNLIDML